MAKRKKKDQHEPY